MSEPMSVFLSLLLSAQAQAAETPASQAAAEPVADTAVTQTAAVDEEVDDDDTIICRRTAVVGSRFKKRICGTKKQWRTLQNRAADTTHNWQRRGKGLEPNDSNKPGG